MCHNTEEWCKIWRGTDLRFEKWHEEFGEFWLNTQKSQNLHFNGLLLTKVYNVFKLKRYSYASLYWRSMQTLKEKWVGVSYMTWGIWGILPEHLKVLKFALWETFLSKVYNVELKTYREVMCHDTEGWCNISRKTDWWFEEWHKEFG